MSFPKIAGRLLLSLIPALLTAPSAYADNAPSPPDPERLAIHTACSATAAKRAMDAGEAQACALNYLLLKLSFLPEIDFETFQGLGLTERHAVQQRGYAAYLAWQNLWTERHASNGGGT